MQLSEFKNLIKSQGYWNGHPSGKIATWVQRIDADGAICVASLAESELNAEQRLKFEQEFAAEFSSKHGVTLTVFFKGQKTTGHEFRPQKKTDAKSGAFGVKFNTLEIPGVKKIICVASGKGGVGKSTVAVNLALSLRNLGFEVGLLDADLYGPSIPKMLGCEGILPDVRDGELWPIDAYGIKTISFASLSPGDAPLIWRGPMVGKALLQFFYQVAWEDLDYLVIDLPPGTGDVQLTMIERLPIHGAVIVSSPQDLSLIDAAKAVQMFRKLRIPILGLVENMSQFICENCGHAHAILGHGGAKSYAEKENLTFLGEVPLHMGYRTSGDQGQPVSAFADHPLAGVFKKAAEKISLQQ